MELLGNDEQSNKRQKKDENNETNIDDEENNGDENESNQKKKGFNPFRSWMEHRKRKQIEKERILLLREQQMMEDLERYLMEIEEKRSWAVLQLNELNYRRIVRVETLAKAERKLKEKEKKEQEENMKEDGLFYKHGSVYSYKRWQQSPAHHYDFEGHKGAVISCKLSSSLLYILSCSEDYTMKVWSMTSGECLKTFTGHTRAVNDGDFHPNFKMYDSTIVSLVSCSGDCTLRLWNSSNTKAISTLYGHDQAVYRCCFSPDGKTILSCSEDKTIRSWSYPEGYNLFVYRAHTSPVVSIGYSNSGRYFVSGSDYGERKILLWDANLPHFHDPGKFPHILYWSPEGLITKILIRKGIPKFSFWLAQSQLGLLKNIESEYEVWTGELSDDEPEISEDERNSDDEDELDDEDETRKNTKKNKKNEANRTEFTDDLKEYKGVLLQIMAISPSGEKLVATEYNPGGHLYISLKATERQVQEAFISGTVKDSRTDIFSENSGMKVGDFSLDRAIPWLPTITVIDEKGKPVQRREPPKTMYPSKDEHSIIYQKPMYDHKDYQSLQPSQSDDHSSITAPPEDVTVLDIAWNCPKPDLGVVVIVINFRFVDSNEWHQLRYSLRESAIRFNAASGEVTATDHKAGNDKYPFDQAERHRLFWQFIRDKEWKSAAAFVDKKAVAFLFDDAVTKRFRVMNLLVDIFDPASWAVLYTPFIFKPGVTRSMVMCDTDFMSDEDFESEEGEEQLMNQNIPEKEDSVMEEGKDGSLLTNSNDNNDDLNTEQQSLDQIDRQESLESEREKEVEEEAEDFPRLLPPGTSEVEEEGSLQQQRIFSTEDLPPPEAIDELPKVRPTTTDQELPKIIWIERIFRAKQILSEIKKQSSDIASRLIELEDNRLSFALETGCVAIHPLFIRFLYDFFNPQHRFYSQIIWPKAIKSRKKLEKVLFSSFPTSYFKLLQQLYSHQQQKLQQRQQREQKTYLSESGEKTLNQLIKSGKFGPEIEEFSMSLPTNFPLRAGQAKYALHDGISIHEQTLAKMKTQSLPRTLEEVYVPTYAERITTLYHQLVRTEARVYHQQLLAICLELSKLIVMQRKCYVSRRRNTYHRLPGLNSHYPNPHYPVPAIIPKEDDFDQQGVKKVIYDTRSYGKDVLKAVIVPPVGRKPPPEIRIDIQNAFFKRRFHAAMINNYSSFGNSHVEYHADVLDNLVPVNFNGTQTGKKSNNRCFSFFFSRKTTAKVNPPPGATRVGYPQSTIVTGRGLTTQPSALSLRTVSSRTDQVSFHPHPNTEGDNSSRLANSSKSNNTSPSKKRRKKKKKGGGSSRSLKSTNSSTKFQQKYERLKVPEGVYLGRRSCYPILPGLELFLDTEIPSLSPTTAMTQLALMYNEEEAVRQQEKKQQDSIITSPSQTAITFEKKKESLNFPGLVRRFYNNGFELAHHGSVNDVAFAPSETRIATAGGDQLIKVWDPRDGTYVYRLVGHTSAVQAVQYTSTEQFLVSAGSDSLIIIWSLLTKAAQRILRGHIDLIHRISISPDCSVLVSAANDGLVKSWYTTPRHPDPPKPPKVITVTDTTALISWISPPCFNCDVTAFHYQYRVGYRGDWIPEGEGQSLAPHLRNRVIEGLIPATHYQFRIRAENRMGKGDWSQPSLLVRTEFGLPETIERPLICQVKRTSMMIGFFSANPTTFGSASMSFHIQCRGDGKSFEENPMHTITLEEGKVLGEQILTAFRHIRQRYYDMKDALIKSHGFHLLTRQSEEERQQFPISIELSIETILSILEKSETDETMLFLGIQYQPLHPGFQYIFRIRGINVAGEGEWSEPTLTINAFATIPDIPSQPRLIQATLRSLTFQWDPPHDDGGTAITGYRIHLLTTNKFIDVPRSTITYTWEGLFPGKAYFLQVLAKNTVGCSEYSLPNDEKDAYTMIAPPEKPMNPLAVGASWNTITYDIYLPYHNGSMITMMEIEKRIIKPFLIGDWENYENVMSNKLNAVLYQTETKFHYNLQALLHPSKERSKIQQKANLEGWELLEWIDLQIQQEELEAKVQELEQLRNKSAVNLLSKNSKHSKLNQEIETLLLQQKPFGSKIRFTVNNLLPDTMYEIRVAFSNSAGKSEFSHPSHRAKTTRAALPEICDPPRILSYGLNYVMLEVYIPDEGGSPIRQFTIEGMDLDTNASRSYTIIRNEYDIQQRQLKLNQRKQQLKEKQKQVEGDINNTNHLLENEKKKVSRSHSQKQWNEKEYDEDDKISYQINDLKSGGSYVFRCRGESAVGPGPYSVWSAEVNLLSEEMEKK